MSVMMGYNGGGGGGGGGSGGPAGDMLYQESSCVLPPYQDSGCGLAAYQDEDCGLPSYQEGTCDLPSHGLVVHNDIAPPRHDLAHGMDYGSDATHLPYVPEPEPPLEFPCGSGYMSNGSGGVVGGDGGRPRRRRRTPPKAKIDINDNSLYSVYCFFKNLLR